MADGLGGLPLEPGGKTELETAARRTSTPAPATASCGLSIPVLPGITPGSGPGHLGLFGYDPLEYRIGRGILEALGINFPVGAKDVAIRGNFCTLDADGKITDRRAGRPTTERCKEMVELSIPGLTARLDGCDRSHLHICNFGRFGCLINCLVFTAVYSTFTCGLRERGAMPAKGAARCERTGGASFPNLHF